MPGLEMHSLELIPRRRLEYEPPGNCHDFGIGNGRTSPIQMPGNWGREVTEEAQWLRLILTRRALTWAPSTRPLSELMRRFLAERLGTPENNGGVAHLIPGLRHINLPRG
jgi:hypothetical protein